MYNFKVSVSFIFSVTIFGCQIKLVAFCLQFIKIKLLDLFKSKLDLERVLFILLVLELRIVLFRKCAGKILKHPSKQIYIF